MYLLWGRATVTRLEGGTGKWQRAAGQIDTKFTYLPAPSESEFLGIDEGTGKISVPTKK